MSKIIDYNVAIYSRKSRFSGKGESIGNQIELCRQYIKLNFTELDDKNILLYEDEGYSGKNTDRPMFKKMINDLNDKKIKAIICYRLDRVSRNVSDFANLIEKLSIKGIDFISIKEKFDTNSNVGRAMMYMASVFSQLERETIAERIKDNMMELAKTGRWLGGITPTGYKSEVIDKISFNGKVNKSHKLVIIKEEEEIIKIIFKKFIEKKSQSKVETYLLQNDIKTKNGKNFSRFAIKKILENPVYLIADEIAYKYFKNLNVDIFNNEKDFDGKNGIMAYNKTIQKKGKTNKIRKIDEWIIAVGKHEGIISSKDWINVQNILGKNKIKSYRRPKNNNALLSGLLFCSCDAYMRPKQTMIINKKGEKVFSYICETKEKSHCKNCNNKNINGNLLDELICEEFKKICIDKKVFLKELKKIIESNFFISNDNYLEINALKKKQSNIENEIKNLVSALSNSPIETHNYIINKIEETHKKNDFIKNQISQFENFLNESFDLEKTTSKLSDFSIFFDLINVEEKREAFKFFLEKVVWDGENIKVIYKGNNNYYN